MRVGVFGGRLSPRLLGRLTPGRLLLLLLTPGRLPAGLLGGAAPGPLPRVLGIRLSCGLIRRWLIARGLVGGMVSRGLTTEVLPGGWLVAAVLAGRRLVGPVLVAGRPVGRRRVPLLLRIARRWIALLRPLLTRLLAGVPRIALIALVAHTDSLDP